MIISNIGSLIQRIANAIIQQEGEPITSTNPGNLRGAPWLVDPLVLTGFWKPANRFIGEAGLVHLVALHVAQGNTLAQFIGGAPGVYAGFAPGADGNKPDVYIKNVMLWAGIPDATVPMWNYIEGSTGGVGGITESSIPIPT